MTSEQTPSIFKSWRDDFDYYDVERNLIANGIKEFVYDGILPNRDILLVTHKGDLTCVPLDEILKIKEAFNCPLVTLEPYQGEILLTLSWNQETSVEPTFGMDEAIKYLKEGRKVYRKGWNGKGMYIYLTKALEQTSPDQIKYEPCIVMYTAQGKHQPGWLASQADLLAEDWAVFNE